MKKDRITSVEKQALIARLGMLTPVKVLTSPKELAS